jgi:hemerythrin HHE cation binding domain-containing protein
MAEMSMNKVIHGAVRRDLDRFVVALDHFPSGDQARAADLSRAWENFDEQLTYHHEGEHRIAWPALQSVGVSPELLTQLDAEHDTMAAALAEARTAIGALARTGGAAEASAARDAVVRLREVTSAHLDHEESEIEGVYQAKRDTPEIKAMGKAFARDGGVSRGGRFFAWVLDGASEEERRAATSEVPGPVLAVLTGIFGRSYRKNVAPIWRR